MRRPLEWVKAWRPSVLRGEAEDDVGLEDTVGDGAHIPRANVSVACIVNNAGVGVATRGIIEEQGCTGVFVVRGGACELEGCTGRGWSGKQY